MFFRKSLCRMEFKISALHQQKETFRRLHEVACYG